MILGSLKPYQLLRNLQQELFPFNFDENLLRELWVQKLPKAVCMVLAPCVGCPLSVAAEVADNTVAFYSQGTPINSSTLVETADQSSAIGTRLAATSARRDRVE
ncbi:unnamed protein product [Echinostoma caproni]|uniref:Uncharacterized protein n=1 Tax=Echinostoma caproni TaxID=27848 RepID=A0A182ZZW9_9TREM|nr:unnamed protein product [Echinostoma caproni]